MKKSILLLLIPFKIFGQLQIDFNDNSLSQWFGDTSHYQIDSLHQLQLFGLNQNEQLVQKGRYILLLEAIHPQAASIVQKKTVVIDY